MVNATQEMLEEARKRFPIGCKYYPIEYHGKLSTYITKQSKECYLYLSEDLSWIIGSSNIYNPITNTWAQLIENTYEVW